VSIDLSQFGNLPPLTSRLGRQDYDARCPKRTDGAVFLYAWFCRVRFFAEAHVNGNIGFACCRPEIWSKRAAIGLAFP